jgi:hypothetical protein
MSGCRTAAGVALALVLIAGFARDGTGEPLEIPFAPLKDEALKDPDNPTKKFRVDFARVEHEFPLSRSDLMKITPDNIATLPQEKVDQIYGRLTAGPIPDGTYLGTLFFPLGDDGAETDPKTRLEEILGGVPGRVAGRSIELLEHLGSKLWKGKVFNRDRRMLRNMIEDAAILRPLVDDSRRVDTIVIPREGPLRRIFEKDEVWLLFPAKVYCGQSLLDGRRESIIVDYAYSDDFPEYRAKPDELGGRGGLAIRDEIRMVRPGFYLGRAYLNRMFLLNFALFNEEAALREDETFRGGTPVKEDCWPGEQERRPAGP